MVVTRRQWLIHRNLPNRWTHFLEPTSSYRPAIAWAARAACGGDVAHESACLASELTGSVWYRNFYIVEPAAFVVWIHHRELSWSTSCASGIFFYLSVSFSYLFPLSLLAVSFFLINNPTVKRFILISLSELDELPSLKFSLISKFSLSSISGSHSLLTANSR